MTENLPLVIWALIADYLPTKSVISLGRINKRLSQTILSEEYWQKRLDSQYHRYDSQKKYEKKTIQQICANIDEYAQLGGCGSRGKAADFPPDIAFMETNSLCCHDLDPSFAFAYQIFEGKIYFIADHGRKIYVIDLQTSVKETYNINNQIIPTGYVDEKYFGPTESLTRWSFQFQSTK
jgi:hypothetical protein